MLRCKKKQNEFFWIKCADSAVPKSCLECSSVLVVEVFRAAKKFIALWNGRDPNPAPRARPKSFPLYWFVFWSIEGNSPRTQRSFSFSSNSTIGADFAYVFVVVWLTVN